MTPNEGLSLRKEQITELILCFKIIKLDPSLYNDSISPSYNSRTIMYVFSIGEKLVVISKLL